MLKSAQKKITNLIDQTSNTDPCPEFIEVFRDWLAAGLVVEREFTPGVSHYFYQERLVARVEFTETNWSAVYFPLTGGIVFDSTAEELDNLPYLITG